MVHTGLYYEKYAFSSFNGGNRSKKEIWQQPMNQNETKQKETKRNDDEVNHKTR